MAHKILGIDLGAYSVKVAELEAGFRQAKLVGLYERRLLPAEEGEAELDRAARTLRRLMDDEDLEAEMFATTLGGEAMLRLVTLPFADRKKVEQVLGFELESQILDDIATLATDFVVSSAEPGATKVIAVAAPREDVKARIEALQRVGAEPRVIGAAALSHAALLGHGVEAPADGAPQMIVDLGHRHTHVCIVHGDKVVFARSVGRGGVDVTDAIVDAFRMRREDAERAKHEQAFLLAPGQVAESPAHRRVDEVVREAVRPLVRELRQTLAAYRAGGGLAPDLMLVTGGAARLRGLVEHLELELGLSAQPLGVPAGDPFVAASLRVGSDREGEDDALSSGLPAQALGLALAAATSVPQVNLRKGELGYRTDYSYLRGKARWLAVSAMAVLLFAGLNAVASLRGLREEGEALEAQLKRATVELFGEARLDGKAVSEELRGGPKGGAPPVPATTAFDVLDEISRAVPPGDKITLDILELDIKPGKTFIKATAESAQQVDDLVDKLEAIECFKSVEKGKISTVTGPPSGDNPSGERSKESKQFTLTITTTCP